MFGQFSAPPAAASGGMPGGAVVDEDPSVVDEDPSVVEVEPESGVVVLDDESEESLVCA
jgi:hypothetical protein